MLWKKVDVMNKCPLKFFLHSFFRYAIMGINTSQVENQNSNPIPTENQKTQTQIIVWARVHWSESSGNYKGFKRVERLLQKSKMWCLENDQSTHIPFQIRWICCRYSIPSTNEITRRFWLEDFLKKIKILV